MRPHQFEQHFSTRFAWWHDYYLRSTEDVALALAAALDHQTLAYPTDEKAVGIGPIDGQVIGVEERDERRDRIEMQSPDGRFLLVGESDGITVTS